MTAGADRSDVEMVTPLRIVLPSPAERPAAVAAATDHWGSMIVTRGLRHPLADAHWLVAMEGSSLLGALSWRDAESDTTEVLTLDAFRPGQRIGAQLLRHFLAGCPDTWLVTTNDNAKAQAFYARMGGRLASVDIDAVVRARVLKPEIPLIGIDGVPIRDEWIYAWGRAQPG